MAAMDYQHVAMPAFYSFPPSSSSYAANSPSSIDQSSPALPPLEPSDHELMDRVRRCILQQDIDFCNPCQAPRHAASHPQHLLDHSSISLHSDWALDDAAMAAAAAVAAAEPALPSSSSSLCSDDYVFAMQDVMPMPSYYPSVEQECFPPVSRTSTGSSIGYHGQPGHTSHPSMHEQDYLHMMSRTSSMDSFMTQPQSCPSSLPSPGEWSVIQEAPPASRRRSTKHDSNSTSGSESSSLHRCFDHGCNGKIFSCAENLRRHVRERSISSRDKVKCPYCNMSFSRKSNRDTHLSGGRCKVLYAWTEETGRPRVRSGTQ